MLNKEFSILLAGDMIITRKWSNNQLSEFQDLVKTIRECDVSIGNLETLIHSFKGFPENNDQGPHMATEPEIAGEIPWAGFNLLSGANNHTNDYGVIGTLENIANLRNVGITIAGIGKDLQEARSPVYFSNGIKVALISATSTFDSWAKASFSMPSVAGRPGINPISLKITYSPFYNFAKYVYQFFMRRGLVLKLPKLRNVKLGNLNVSIGKEISGEYKVDKNDVLENLKIIEEAKKNAEIVVFSCHSHEGTASTPPEFLLEFAHGCIDAGADIFFVHGPHYFKGIEIYKNKPIFYGLGNFAFETDSIGKLPSQYYDKWKIDYSVSTREALKISESEFNTASKYWESFVPVIKFKADKISEVIIYPISLGFDKPEGVKGTPYLSDKTEGRRIIKRISDLSMPYNVSIGYNDSLNHGKIQID
jgi:poly-gamma-glutamate capsule biosynthesis protein CapA/YwtB (metallophosphatase superfamily)